jgi:hypothetical protein
MIEPTRLDTFAYGEQLEGTPPRSLGFRLLAPAERQPWCEEVETLARRLQAAPYPDAWPATDLFCSLLLSDGRRLVAAARYGLADHTPSRRRGGLELVGVIGPAGLSVTTARAIYHGLRQRRQQTDNLRTFTGTIALSEALAPGPPADGPSEAVPVLPIRMWQDGVVLFAATSPADPDLRLGLLEQGAGSGWQWLPLVGPDFPLTAYARRGPLVAWTPNLAGVALKLDQPPPAPASRPRRWLLPAAAVVLAALLGGNLWLGLTLRRDFLAVTRSAASPSLPVPAAAPPEPVTTAGREQLAHALYRALVQANGKRDWSPAQLLAAYEALALRDDDLRLTTPEGRQAVGAIALLARQRPSQLEDEVRHALSNRGFDPELVDLACRRIHEFLTAGGELAPNRHPPGER